jgi:hypothetical protein
MPSYIFINTVTAVVCGAASLLRAGNSTDDVEVVMAALDAGGMVGPATDPYLQYGATVAQAMRGRGANEVDISAMMTAVFAGSAYNAAAGAVVGVTGTAPIGTTTSHGVAVVSISPATDGLPGSMSAADKAKLDAMPAITTLTDDLTGPGASASQILCALAGGRTAVVEVDLVAQVVGVGTGPEQDGDVYSFSGRYTAKNASGSVAVVAEQEQVQAVDADASMSDVGVAVQGAAGNVVFAYQNGAKISAGATVRWTIDAKVRVF